MKKSTLAIATLLSAAIVMPVAYADDTMDTSTTAPAATTTAPATDPAAAATPEVATPAADSSDESGS